MKLLGLYLQYISNRLLLGILLAILIAPFLLLRYESIGIAGFEINNPAYEFLSTKPTWLFAVIVLIMDFVFLIIIELFLILFFAINKNVQARKNNYFHKRMNAQLFPFLCQPDTNTEEKAIEFNRGMRHMLNNFKAKSRLINRLRRIMLITKGDVHSKCFLIFKTGKFDKLVNALIKSPYLTHKLYALKIINDFEITGHEKTLKKHIRSKSSLLQSEAIVTYIKVTKNTDLVFLVDNKIDLSIGDFNRITRSINDHPNVNYLALLNSSLPMHVALGLCLLKAQKAHYLKHMISRFFDHEDEIVQEEAVVSYLSFIDNDDDISYLMDEFDRIPQRFHNKVINAIHNYTDKSHLKHFYEKIIELKIIETKILAMEKLFDLDARSVMKYRNHENKEIQDVCNQVLDLNI